MKKTSFDYTVYGIAIALPTAIVIKAMGFAPGLVFADNFLAFYHYWLWFTMVILVLGYGGTHLYKKEKNPQEQFHFVDNHQSVMNPNLVTKILKLITPFEILGVLVLFGDVSMGIKMIICSLFGSMYADGVKELAKLCKYDQGEPELDPKSAQEVVMNVR